MRNSTAGHALGSILSFTVALFGCSSDSGDNELGGQLEAASGDEARVELIPEAATLIRTVSDMSFSGSTLIESETETSCRSLDLAFDLAFTADGASATDRSYLIFYEGVTFSFRGDTCIPAQGSTFERTGFNFSQEMDEGGSMTRLTRGGPIVISGPGRRTGTGSLVVGEDQAVFQITSAPADPIVLELTSDGFRYVSGRGVVITPDGKSYEF